MNQYRTPTVVSLCESMRETQDYSALPILADALQDADFNDEEKLHVMRTPDLDKTHAQRIVALVYSEGSAASVRWLDQFVRDINYKDYPDDATDEDYDSDNGTPSDTNPHDYEYVIDQGYQGKKSGGMHFGSEDGADYFRASDNKHEFWRNWALATGEKPPDDPTTIYAGCAC